tara:strand:+ start:426 stop:659 length:234 start_codon:yes stop_codon:yes gene_type:complete
MKMKKKSHVLTHFKNNRQIALSLGISSQAVGEWSEEIPELRAYQLTEIVKKRESDKAKMKLAHKLIDQILTEDLTGE